MVVEDAYPSDDEMELLMSAAGAWSSVSASHTPQVTAAKAVDQTKKLTPSKLRGFGQTYEELLSACQTEESTVLPSTLSMGECGETNYRHQFITLCQDCDWYQFPNIFRGLRFFQS